MLGFLMPADVRRSFKLPPIFVDVGENVLSPYGSERGKDRRRTENSSAPARSSLLARRATG
jgi:hypothetical protein